MFVYPRSGVENTMRRDLKFSHDRIGTKMIYNNVILEVTEQTDIETVHALLHRQGELSRQEPGCTRFEVYQSQTERSLFMLIERWETLEDLERHRKATAFKEIYEPQVLPLVTRVPHPSDLVFS